MSATESTRKFPATGSDVVRARKSPEEIAEKAMASIAARSVSSMQVPNTAVKVNDDRILGMADANAAGFAKKFMANLNSVLS